jgi:hypothetical protein
VITSAAEGRRDVRGGASDQEPEPVGVGGDGSGGDGRNLVN